MNDKKDKITVHRITIDERLAEDIIRIEICKLIAWDNESGEFTDKSENWRDGKFEHMIVVPKKEMANDNYYADIMSIPEAEIKQVPWKSLKEGQVFLSGEFNIKEENNGEKKRKYFIKPGAKAFEQISDDVKEDTRNLYFEILSKGNKDV